MSGLFIKNLIIYFYLRTPSIKINTNRKIITLVSQSLVGRSEKRKEGSDVVHINCQ